MVKTPTNYGKINMYLQLEDAIQFKLDEVNKFIDYFIADICKRKTMIK